VIPRRLLAGAAIVIGLAGVALVGAGPSTAQAAPGATVEPSTANLGASVIARGSGFAPGTLVSVEVCGNEGRRGSADCDQATALDAGASPTGDVAVQLTVGTPPSPCPCIVKLSGLSSTASATTPINIIGAPAADPAALAAEFPDVSRQVEVVDPHFEGTGPWTAWFGGSPERDLVYTVQNTGNVAVQDPPLIIALGKGSTPTGIVHPPPIGSLEPGESRTYHTTVELGALAFGQYNAVGQIPGFVNAVTFKASTTTYPWALILIVVLVAFELILIISRNRVRARVARTSAAGAPALTGPMPALNPGPVLVGAGVGAEAPLPATSSLQPEELEDAIVIVLTETLRAMHGALGERQLTDDEATRLASTLAEEVSAAVGSTLELTPSDQAMIAQHLEGELGRVLSGADGLRRGLAGVGTSPA